MKIRNTTEADEPAIRRVHQAAFGAQEGNVVADLASALLHDPTASPFISLLAFEEEEPIGHVLFTRGQIAGEGRSMSVQLLAPLAVVPERQGQGAGTQLVRSGLKLLTGSGCDLVFVLGHPEYYPRFGFRPAEQHGFLAPYPIPEKVADAWMVLELRPGILGSLTGSVRCADVLNKPEYWRE
ncbi:MAG TPA: N-acetyltransferase [Kiritimatiellia bacterium]|nr:N-acetyltransferase [Kiritimatiellia bacterium]